MHTFVAANTPCNVRGLPSLKHFYNQLNPTKSTSQTY